MSMTLKLTHNTEDETGFPWSYLDEGADRDRIVPGRHVIAGAGNAVAVAEVMDVADDGLVHVRPVRGTLESNRHLLSATDAG